MSAAVSPTEAPRKATSACVAWEMTADGSAAAPYSRRDAGAGA
jgi:hypothetical protein